MSHIERLESELTLADAWAFRSASLRDIRQLCCLSLIDATIVVTHRHGCDHFSKQSSLALKGMHTVMDADGCRGQFGYRYLCSVSECR